MLTANVTFQIEFLSPLQSLHEMLAFILDPC
jgi:hypothetical protein